MESQVERNRRASREYYQRNATRLCEEQKARQRQKKQEDPEYFNKKNREYHSRNMDKRRLWGRRSRIRTLYGIELEQYHEMMVKQGSKCAICKTALGAIGVEHFTNYALDHCHQTGTIRKFLCKKCNSGIGYFGDNPELLMKAHAYLTGGK